MKTYLRRATTRTLSAMLALSLMASADAPTLERTDRFIPGGDPGIELFLRHVCATPCDPALRPVLLVHGARVPGVASFDLDIEGGSLAADLALAGFSVYILDVRGYGASTRPEAMSRPPEHGETLVRTPVAVRDLGAAVEHVAGTSPDGKVALLGWATGGHWAGSYASQSPERVSHLVLYNCLSSGSDFHGVFGRRSPLDDPEEPGTFNHAQVANYRLSRGNSLFGMWNRTIPLSDKDAWRDPELAAAYAEAALASDPTSGDRDPPSFRSPSGALEDAFYLAIGQPAWDPEQIEARVLILASERDYWSRPSDRTTLTDRMINAASVHEVLIPGATHFVHLDRPERGRTTFLEAVTSFLAREAPPAQSDDSVLLDMLSEAAGQPVGPD